MNLKRKIWAHQMCSRFVFGSVALGALAGGLLMVTGQKDIQIYDIPVLGPLVMVWQLLFGIAFISMIVFLYEIDPGIQLRGKNKDYLEKIVLDSDKEIWHSKAIELLKKMEDESSNKSA